MAEPPFPGIQLSRDVHGEEAIQAFGNQLPALSKQ
jgi:hypothetical protein